MIQNVSYRAYKKMKKEKWHCQCVGNIIVPDALQKNGTHLLHPILSGVHCTVTVKASGSILTQKSGEYQSSGGEFVGGNTSGQCVDDYVQIQSDKKVRTRRTGKKTTHERCVNEAVSGVLQGSRSLTAGIRNTGMSDSTEN